MSSGVSSISASFNSMARRSDSQKTSIATWIGHSFPSMRMSTEVTAVSFALSADVSGSKMF